MKLVLIGYGKMGRTIEEVALQEGHEVLHRITREHNDGKLEGEWVGSTDVLVDFSVASAVVSNVERAVEAGLPIVVGTTGWQDQADRVRQIVQEGEGACLYSSNFSLGVQALFYLSRVAAQLLVRFEEFSPYVSETHHQQKKDAPSGTALKLQTLLEESYRTPIPVSSLRVGYFPGSHELGFDSEVDTLRLVHTARNRLGFARGVLYSCEWIHGEKGFFQLEEVLFRD